MTTTDINLVLFSDVAALTQFIKQWFATKLGKQLLLLYIQTFHLPSWRAPSDSDMKDFHQLIQHMAHYREKFTSFGPRVDLLWENVSRYADE